MKNYRVSVFNTITRKYEMVEVTEEVYKEYMHDEWNTKKATARFYKHHVTAAYMAQDTEEFFEQLDSYVKSCEKRFEESSDHNDLAEMIGEAMKTLSTRDRKLIQALFYDGYTEKEYAEMVGINQSNIHRRKKRILRILRNYLEEFS
ncbi:MAG: sigma-70 family RNA polymerase sigma factor [Saccharofermentans sp.]|nr:sigma-70 family RNA polymerase sigma factor [Saccharofermentans sp.]